MPKLPVRVSEVLKPLADAEKRLKDRVERAGIVLPPGPLTVTQSNIASLEGAIEEGRVPFVPESLRNILPFAQQQTPPPPALEVPEELPPPPAEAEIEFEWGATPQTIRRFSYTW